MEMLKKEQNGISLTNKSSINDIFITIEKLKKINNLSLQYFNTSNKQN